MNEHQDSLPLLPLRDVVVYPHMVIPLFVGRDKSVKALEKAMEEAAAASARASHSFMLHLLMRSRMPNRSQRKTSSS